MATTANAPSAPPAENGTGAAANDSNITDEQLATAEKNYKLLKRKLKYLLYEQEALAEDLRKSRRKVLRISKEKEYLLDRLLRYENVPTSEDEGSTASEAESDDLPLMRTAIAKKLEDEHKASARRAAEAKEAARKKRKKKDGSKDESLSQDHGEEKKAAEPKKQETRCRAQPCKNKPLTGLKYCRKHAPLDPNSGFIYCTYRDPATKAQTCKMVIRRDMSIPLCPTHRRSRLETQSPTTAAAPSPAPGASAPTPTPPANAAAPTTTTTTTAAAASPSSAPAAATASSGGGGVAEKSTDEIATPSKDAVDEMEDDVDDED